jgi:hypothetical protein
MNLRFVFISVFSITISLANAQTQEPLKTLVLYDPLFWKDELKLDVSQSRKINEINFEYYERLVTAVHEESNDRKALQLTVAQSLLNRSQLIWETFHPKQKKKWKKMWKHQFSSGSEPHAAVLSGMRTSLF